MPTAERTKQSTGAFVFLEGSPPWGYKLRQRSRQCRTLIEDRLASLETFTGRLVLAGDDSDGSGAWRNYLEQRLQQERKFSQEVVAIALAGMRDHIVDLCKTTIDAALSKTIRGTYDPKASYAANDLVACDGASFLAKCDSPGRCPGPNWQLIAQQGKRGVRGPPGERGLPGKIISGWVVDRSNYTITPLYSDGGVPGPALDLSTLFPNGESDGT